MTYIAILLVLCSAFLHALKSLFIKQSKNKEVFLWLYSVLALIIYFPAFVYFSQKNPFSLYEIFFWGAITGYIHLLYRIFFTRSYEDGDLSHVYPIMRSSPALVLVCAIIFLDEQVTLIGVSGIAIVVFGVYLINLKHFAVQDFLEPVKSLFHERGSRFAFLTMLSVAAYSLVDKVGAVKFHKTLLAI